MLKALVHLFNAILRTGLNWTLSFTRKVTQIIFIPKLGKPATEVSSYCPITLLPVVSKFFEKLFLGRLKQKVHELQLNPDHQFGFRDHCAITEQVHRVVEQINNAFENKKNSSAVFLDRVWHQGLLSKLKTQLPATYFQVHQSYLTNRFFMVKYQKEITDQYPI